MAVKDKKPKEIMSLADLTPDPRNARKHNPRNIGQVQDSLQRYGASRSIVIDESGHIIAGHGVVEAAALAGIERVQVVDGDGETIIAVRRSGLTVKQKQELGIADNRGAELAEWDADVLASLAGEIDLSQFWHKDELAELLKDTAGNDDEDPGADVDRAAELQAKWGTALGQMWKIGEHRLLCGDCTVRENVERVMGGEKAALMLTDPPYGVDYGQLVASRKNQKQGGWDDIENDALSDDDLYALLEKALDGAGALVGFVWHPAGARRSLFWKAVISNGWKVAQEIVWVKNALVFGRSDYQWRHEPCLYLKRDGAPRQDDRTQTTVWEVSKPSKSIHPTQKPVELFEIAVRNHTQMGQTVFEPFSGSGTTIVACERLGRKCRAIEISPAYVAVTLERLSGLGLVPELLS